MADVLIIGSGITGAALAYECARRGDQVRLVSAHLAGGLASAASFGWINASFYHSPAHFALRMAGMQAHRRLVAGLPDLPTRWQGCLWYEEVGEAQAAAGRRLAALGYVVQGLDMTEISGMIPALGPVPETALFFADEGAAHPADLARALIAASGASLVQGQVTGLVVDAGRVTGAVTDAGILRADRVVLATGVGTPALLAPLGLDLPMLDRPGVVVVTRPLPPLCPVIVASPSQEVRQDDAGRLWAPASASHQADDADQLAEPPGALVEATLSRLRALFPSAKITAERHMAANRPVPGDGLPVAGPSAVPGLWLAVMHSGATLAPAVAEMLAEEMKSGLESPLLAEFRPARYAL